MELLPTIIVLLILAAVIGLAVRSVKKHGTCDCGNANCPKSGAYRNNRK